MQVCRGHQHSLEYTLLDLHLPMVGKSDSQALQRRKYLDHHAQLMQTAVELYRKNTELPKAEQKSLRAVCVEVSSAHLDKTGEWIKLDKNTLARLSADSSHRTLSEFNAEKGWLHPEEANYIVEYVIELANRGFPLSHRRLKEVVDDLLRKRLGPDFPGVGQNWTDRFVTKHHTRLGRYWSRSLESKRGRAVNPTTHKEWFDLLEATIRDNGIEPDCIYGSDEVGFSTSLGQKERVIGGKGKTVQHQVRDGNRENITVIPTICADGTAIPPLVIFKGKAFQVRWLQDNPLNAS